MPRILTLAGEWMQRFYGNPRPLLPSLDLADGSKPPNAQRGVRPCGYMADRAHGPSNHSRSGSRSSVDFWPTPRPISPLSPKRVARSARHSRSQDLQPGHGIATLQAGRRAPVGLAGHQDGLRTPLRGAGPGSDAETGTEKSQTTKTGPIEPSEHFRVLTGNCSPKCSKLNGSTQTGAATGFTRKSNGD